MAATQTLKTKCARCQQRVNCITIIVYNRGAKLCAPCADKWFVARDMLVSKAFGDYISAEVKSAPTSTSKR